jgi:hypothetical protein
VLPQAESRSFRITGEQGRGFLAISQLITFSLGNDWDVSAQTLPLLLSHFHILGATVHNIPFLLPNYGSVRTSNNFGLQKKQQKPNSKRLNCFIVRITGEKLPYRLISSLHYLFLSLSLSLSLPQKQVL